MTDKERQAWLNLIVLDGVLHQQHLLRLIQPRSSTCLRNFLKEDMSPELHDMITKELEVREV